MKFIQTTTSALKEYKSLKSALRSAHSTAVAAGLPTQLKANIIHTLCADFGAKAFVVVSEESQAQTLANDLAAMGGKPLVYPVRDFNFRNMQSISKEYEHSRINVLCKMASGDYTAVIACIDAAAQYTIPPYALKKATLNLSCGAVTSVEEITSALVLAGYERAGQVEGPGQFAVRGGIIDFFMPDSDNPIRVELWGDEVDTLNYFDIETQRRTDYIEEVSLTPSAEIMIENKNALADKIEHKAQLLKGKNAPKARELLYRQADDIRNGVFVGSMDKFIGLAYEQSATLFDYADPNTIFFMSESTKTRERLRSYDRLFEEELKECFAQGILCRGFETYSIDKISINTIFSENRFVYLENFASSGYELPINEIVTFNLKQLSLWSGSVKVLTDDLQELHGKNGSIVILAGTEKAASSLCDELNEKGYDAQLVKDIENPANGQLYVMPGGLSAGFEYPQTKFTLITHGISRTSGKRKRKRDKNSQQIYSLSELSSGDYVVHSTHGIGVFRGIHKIEIQGVVKDYIKVEYAKGDTLYVPVTQLDLISKYIGPHENSAVKISRLGSGDWQKTKARVRRNVKDIANELTKLYAERMASPGHAFPPDGEWQRDFEASFEYEETDDQLRCIDEIKGDMERTAPMDRLLCGDVGFGKTEVALRAAFKCVTDSKQCVLLCPTTILAWQHYQTVMNRFEGYPVRIELLSRFRTPKQQADIIKRLARGEIDMIIGTHRVVQKDVRFRDLGLVIIDEEQRFGVAQKERFKEICKNVDVLTLSATPIPRTLNMAMSGIRDMSTLDDAPQDRHPVQTYVLEHDDGIIAEAIRRELRRGGQVFYLHNRVESIERCAARLSSLVPEAKLAIAHGKMSENELSDIWQRMLEQDINLLVCTTIIETGIDLPNANTLIIEDADHMGLSQLHQLRGRVGRSARRAYAYFTFRPQKVLTEISQKRLNAIKEFTEFGSGFKIAMRDLELRGAGNVLGAQQHGHMEDVGYDMYLKLLGEALNEAKGEKKDDYTELECLVDVQVQAHIPESYIESLGQRLDIYKRISDIRTQSDARDVADELIDRFGEPPKSVLGLINVALTRSRAASKGIYEIKQQNSSLLLYTNNIKNPFVGEVISRFKGSAFLNAGSKPYISIKFQSGMTPNEMLKLVFFEDEAANAKK